MAHTITIGFLAIFLTLFPGDAFAETTYDLDVTDASDGTLTGFVSFSDSQSGTSLTLTDATDFDFTYTPDIGPPLIFDANAGGTIEFFESFGSAALNPKNGSWGISVGGTAWDLFLADFVWDVEENGVPIDAGEDWRLVRRAEDEEPIPEPSSLVLAFVGLIVVAGAVARPRPQKISAS